MISGEYDDAGDDGAADAAETPPAAEPGTDPGAEPTAAEVAGAEAGIEPAEAPPPALAMTPGTAPAATAPVLVGKRKAGPLRLAEAPFGLSRLSGPSSSCTA